MALTRIQKVDLLKKVRSAFSGVRLEELTQLQPVPTSKNGITMMATPDVQPTWKEDVLDYIEELKQKRFIQVWDEHNPNRFKFSTRGADYAEKFITGSDDVVPDLDELLRDAELREKALTAYRAGDYEDAVFKAYKAVEERLRKMASAGAGDIGAALVSKALNPTGGILRIPTCAVPAEEEGAHMLFRGAIQLFKNPSSHRTVDWSNAVSTAQVLCLADMLLATLSTAVPR